MTTGVNSEVLVERGGVSRVKWRNEDGQGREKITYK